MTVHPAKLTTAGVAIYILSWLFIFNEWFQMGSQWLYDTVEPVRRRLKLQHLGFLPFLTLVNHMHQVQVVLVCNLGILLNAATHYLL